MAWEVPPWEWGDSPQPALGGRDKDERPGRCRSVPAGSEETGHAGRCTVSRQMTGTVVATPAPNGRPWLESWCEEFGGTLGRIYPQNYSALNGSLRSVAPSACVVERENGPFCSVS